MKPAAKIQKMIDGIYASAEARKEVAIH